MIAQFFVTVALLFQLFQQGLAGFNFEEYKCAVCVPTFQTMIEEKTMDFQKTCERFFPESLCSKFQIPSMDSGVIPRLGAREHCQKLRFCFAPDYSAVANDIDVRVTKALGSKGYDKIRLSVISNSTVSSPYFDYSQPFKYRWTNKYLNTGLVTVTPGQTTTFNIAGKDISIHLPNPTEGVRGIILADPCFTSEWIVCIYKDKYKTFEHVPELLNAMIATGEIEYWQILGDNFYDQTGDASSTWFASLSDATKSKILATTPGNHDFWVNSSPTLSVPWDQYGNGLMQFYGQDTIAATSSSPYDFSVDPDGSYGNDRGENIPPASNFFFYNQIGNTAFIGYSGAHNYNSMINYFTEACNWASSVNPDVVLLVGHWNSKGDGCEDAASVPNVYEELKALPSCAAIVPKLKYFMGHKHCNMITSPDVGFMVGGGGMSDKDCNGDFGFPVVDTTGGRFRVYYFPIAHASDYDNYDSILSCVKSKGVSGCYDLATKWVDLPLN